VSEVLDEVIAAAPLVPLSQSVEVNPKLDRSLLNDDLDVSFVPMAAVEALSGGIEVSTIRKYAEVKKGYTHFRDGDILFAKVTPCMENGKMAIARKLINGVGFGSTEFHVLRPRAGVDARYIYYFVSSQTFRKEASGHMTGAVGLRRVPSAYLEEQLIPLPDIGRQREIVAELEKQFSRLDEAVANLQRVKSNLKRYKASVLKAAVEGSLTNHGSECFRRVRLGHVVALNPRLPKGSLDDSASVSFVPMAAVGADDGRIDSSASRCYSEVRKGYTYFSDGDVLFAKVTPCMENGKIAVAFGLLGGCGFGSTEFHVLRPRDAVDPQYVHCLVSSESFRKEAARHMTGAVGLRRVPTTYLETVEVLVPSLNIQRVIVAEVDRHLSIIREVEVEVDTNLKRAQALRQATLTKCFSY
jgi:type I restriction enzyme S subunit